MMSAPSAGRAADAFTSIVGRAPDGVWSAPGRLNLVGEHTDYNEGLVLPVAIDRRASVAVGLRADGMVRCASLQFAGVVTAAAAAIAPGAANRWAAPLLGTAWALAADSVAVCGADIVIDSDIPPGGGLASSAAVEVATALALTELTGHRLPTPTLARCCQRGEHFIARAPTGLMDQMAVLLGAAGHAVLLDCRTLEHTLVGFSPAPRGLALMVMDTGVRHDNSGPGYRERRAECEAAARALGLASLRDADLADVEGRLTGVLRARARHVVTENARVAQAARLLELDRFADFGRLLDQSHASLRDDLEVSCAELDIAVMAARSSGALGARMTGGGFGGSALALVPLGGRERVHEAVMGAFMGAGLRAARVFEVGTADGAARIG